MTNTYIKPIVIRGLWTTNIKICVNNNECYIPIK